MIAFPRIHVNEKEGQLEIVITPHWKNLVSLISIFYGLLLILFSYVIFYTLLSNIENFSIAPLYAIFMVAFAAMLLVGGYNLFNSITQKEMIECNKKLFVYKKFSLISSRRIEIEISQIHYVRMSGHNKFTDHPFKKFPMDYTGIGAQEAQVQYMIRDGVISLEYGKQELRFGKDLISDDAEIIIKKIRQFVLHRSGTH